MRGFLHIDPGDAVPIWRQIEAGVARLIASRALQPGMAVPSVRELSRELQVNPATVVKAYQRLVDAGHLVIRRGEGTYVADEAPQMRSRERGRLLKEAALRYATVAFTAGSDRAEALAAVEEAWQQLERERKGATP